MKATLSKDGQTLTIEMQFDKTGATSKSGKTKVHASTHGNVAVNVDGFEKPLSIGINVYSK